MMIESRCHEKIITLSCCAVLHKCQNSVHFVAKATTVLLVELIQFDIFTGLHCYLSIILFLINFKVVKRDGNESCTASSYLVHTF